MRVFYFRHRDAPEHHEVLLPEGAPERFGRAGELWNAAEAAERRKDAQVAREIVLALPADREMTTEDRVAMARFFAQEHSPISTASIKAPMLQTSTTPSWIMPMTRDCTLCVLLLTACFSAKVVFAATSNSESAASLVTIGNGGKAMCQLTGNTDLLNAQLAERNDQVPEPGHTQDCIKTKETEIRDLYIKLLHQLKSKTAKAAVKNYYAGWLIDIEGTVPNPGEDTSEYRSRQNAADAQLLPLATQMRAEADD